MEAKKVTAIVTRAVRYNETDMILTLVSIEEGKLTATAKGCLKPKAKLRYSAEPMNFGEYMLAGKSNRYVVADCAQIESFMPLTLEIDKYYSASYILEALTKLSPESQPKLFLHAIETLKGMAYENVGAEEGMTKFLLHALSDNGYNLDFSTCNVCKCVLDGEAVFSERDGIVCPHCAGFDGIVIDKNLRAYLAGENQDIPNALKTNANLILSDVAYSMLGLKMSKHYFTEQI